MKKVIPNDAVLVPDHAQKVFSGMIFDVYQWQQKLFDGSEHTFEMLKRTDTVNAICIVDDKILVIDDEQPHLGSRTSLPGGRVDPDDDDILAAIKREILEETGYDFEDWRLVKVTQTYRKIEWFVYTWLACNVKSKQEVKLDPGEKINVKTVSFKEFKSLVMTDTDYLTESRSLLSNTDSLSDLLNLPEVSGKEVDR